MATEESEEEVEEVTEVEVEEIDPTDGVVDTLTLRFVGTDKDGTALHELRAAHVAEVLQGIVGITSDFSKAGAFGDGPAGSEVLVRPAREGSFIIEVIRAMEDHPVTTGTIVTTVPGLASIIFWATKSMRADVSNFEYLDNDMVKVSFQDNTVEEVPRAAWDELNKRKRRRKKHLRQIMAPLSDKRVDELEVTDQDPPAGDNPPTPTTFTLTRPDYDAVKLDDEVDTKQNIFDVEAQMSAIDFDNREKWRVKVKGGRPRSATVQDEEFLGRVASGLALRQSDIFRLRVREDITEKNGRTTTKWTVLKVESFRRAAHDDDE